MSAAEAQEAVVGLIGERFGTQRLQAFDIATGELTADHEVSEATVWSASSERVAVRWHDQDERSDKFGILDPATGDLTSVAEGNSGSSCLGDSTTPTLVCFTRDAAAAYDTDSQELLWSLPNDGGTRIGPRRVVSLWHGIVYAEDSEGNPYAIDARTGEDVAVDVGVAPFQVSTTHGVWFDSDGPKIAPAVR